MKKILHNNLTVNDTTFFNRKYMVPNRRHKKKYQLMVRHLQGACLQDGQHLSYLEIKAISTLISKRFALYL